MTSTVHPAHDQHGYGTPHDQHGYGTPHDQHGYIQPGIHHLVHIARYTPPGILYPPGYTLSTPGMLVYSAAQSGVRVRRPWAQRGRFPWAERLLRFLFFFPVMKGIPRRAELLRLSGRITMSDRIAQGTTLGKSLCNTDNSHRCSSDLSLLALSHRCGIPAFNTGGERWVQFPTGL